MTKVATLSLVYEGISQWYSPSSPRAFLNNVESLALFQYQVIDGGIKLQKIYNFPSCTCVNHILFAKQIKHLKQRDPFPHPSIAICSIKRPPYPPHLSSPQGLQLFLLCSWIYLIERDMYRVHPTENKCQARGPAKNACPSMLTVWKKSSMTFQGTDGFSVYDSTGQMVFRVDNYARRNRCMTRGLVLMDGSGRPLMTMRPQVTN